MLNRRPSCSWHSYKLLSACVCTVPIADVPAGSHQLFSSCLHDAGHQLAALHWFPAMSSRVVTGRFMSPAFGPVSLVLFRFIHNKSQVSVYQLVSRLPLSTACLPAHVYGMLTRFCLLCSDSLLRAMSPPCPAYVFGTVRIVSARCWCSHYNVNAYSFIAAHFQQAPLRWCLSCCDIIIACGILGAGSMHRNRMVML